MSDRNIQGTSHDRAAALDHALAVAQRACDVVMAVYAQDFEVDYKAKNDPVTRADREANALITEALAAAYPDIPIVAEESDPASFGAYATAPCAWFVDPLDGTREFVAKNGEFAVMIGLAEAGRASLGVIVLPAARRAFAGAVGVPAFEVVGATRRPIRVSSTHDAKQARVVISRSHAAPELAGTVARLGTLHVRNVGSAGMKGALVACGEADIYVHTGRSGKRWDSCAPEALVRAAGGELTNALGTFIDYRSADLANVDGILTTNGVLHPAGLVALAAR